jgi:hypothetical protein
VKYQRIGVLLVDNDGDVSVQLYEDPLKGLSQFENWRGQADQKVRATYICLEYEGDLKVRALTKELPEGPSRETAWRLGEGPLDVTKVSFRKHPLKWVRRFFGRIFRG